MMESPLDTTLLEYIFKNDKVLFALYSSFIITSSSLLNNFWVRSNRTDHLNLKIAASVRCWAPLGISIPSVPGNLLALQLFLAAKYVSLKLLFDEYFHMYICVVR